MILTACSTLSMFFNLRDFGYFKYLTGKQFNKLENDINNVI
jgi:hypothetical protein